MVNYTVVLMDILNGIMEEVKVDTNSCVDDICSIAYDNLLLNQTYSITVTATNILGSSMPTFAFCKVVDLKLRSCISCFLMLRFKYIHRDLVESFI